MLKATVTVRELKNKASGFDVSIPKYNETAGLLGSTVEYMVVAVSNLDAFKSPKHKDTDVVQFSVGKKLSDFEDLHKKLNEKFSGTAFPPLPRKVLLKSDAVNRERRNGLEHFLQFLAVVPKMVSSPVFLEFLGVSSTKAGKFSHVEESESKDEEGGEKEEDKEETTNEGEKKENVDAFDEEEADSELFLDEGDENDDIFVGMVTTTDNTAMFDNPDLGGGLVQDEADDLVLPSAIVEKQTTQEADMTEEDRENSELLKIEDDLDELLSEKKKSSKSQDLPSDAVETKEETENFRPIPAPRKLKPNITSKPITITSKPDIASKTKPAASKPEISSKPKPTTTKPGIKAKPKPISSKPGTKTKPLLPSKPNSKDDNTETSPDSSEIKTPETVDLSNDDIMKYITDNSSADADLDLF